MFPFRLPRLARVSIVVLLACETAPPPQAPLPPSLAAIAIDAAVSASVSATGSTPPAPPIAPGDDERAVRKEAQAWRDAHLLIDLHEHIDPTPEYLARAVAIQDAVGIGLAVNLSGGTVTRRGPLPSDFERTKAISDRLFPGRFLEYVNLDYASWDEPDFSARGVKQIEEGYRLGAAGLKEFKRLGLYLRDRHGQLLHVDDPKLDPVWRRCGELGMPVSIHTADPRAFWLPFAPSNERWEELKDHKGWWFGDPARYPPREELLAELDRVIARHPETTFVSVHFANNAEDLAWVDASLDRHPNMMADLAARVPEIGRHDPEDVRRLFLKHQDRILFATDFQVDDRLTLGSGGHGPPPTDADAKDFFDKHWRWLETRDKNFPHMTPIQGSWTISGIGLPVDVLRKIYFENARRLLARSLPPPSASP
jgi:predicted TIM-barrel fold metal-dependent hydrolase